MHSIVERLKHELSVLGLASHLHKDHPDLDVVAELTRRLYNEKDKTEQLSTQLKQLQV
jgi:hypothetical protein